MLLSECEKQLKEIALKYINALNKNNVKIELNCNNKINMVKLSYTVYE